MQNYYSFLKLRENASSQEIELAFDRFKNELLKFSPGIEISEAELKQRDPETWNAFGVLLNPETRKLHDEAIERERIHMLYEENMKVEEKKDHEIKLKQRYVGFGLLALLISVYFLSDYWFAGENPETPNWRTHYITNEIKAQLPSKPQKADNILHAPILGFYLNAGPCYKSELSNGFSVVFTVFEMGSQKISMKDLSMITSSELQNPHLRDMNRVPDLIMNINEYQVLVKKGTYRLENVIRAFCNYTFVRGEQIVKVIVNYTPEDPLQEKYTEIISESLLN